MTEIGTRSTRHLPRHLHSPEAVARAVGALADADVTRSRGQGNGLRIHRIYFAVVSLAAFVLVMAAVFIATESM